MFEEYGESLPVSRTYILEIIGTIGGRAYLRSAAGGNAGRYYYSPAGGIDLDSLHAGRSETGKLVVYKNPSGLSFTMKRRYFLNSVCKSLASLLI